MKDPLQAAALAVSSAKGDSIFQELTRLLATILGVQTALIGRVTDKTPRTVRTLGIFGGGTYRENFEYPLDITPCREVMRGGFILVASDLAAQFPEDVYLPRGAAGYAGYPLLDGAGRPAGVIAVMTREPITDPGLYESVMKIFALRAAAEIERRAQEEVLAASEANYRAIFEASEDAIFLHDYETGAILDVNPKACSTFGYSREEMKRLKVGELSGNEPPYTHEEAMRLIGEVRAGRGPLRFEWRRRNKDGTLHWDEVTLKKVDIAGRAHVIAMTHQITERKAAVEALKASEEQYRAIFNASADSLVLRDADFRVVDVNPAYEKMSGRTKAEALGRDTLTMSPPELTDHVRRLHARALAGEPVMFEALARRKDGSRFNIETRGVPILHQGKPHVLYIGRDITAKKGEEELLRASEEQYRAIFDASADALVLWDEHVRRVDINPAYERIYGYTRAEVLAPGYDEQVRPAKYAERRRDLVQRTLAGERCQVELESLRKDGRPIHVEVRTIPIQHRGRPHVLAISRDVTERMRAEAAVRASEERYRLLFEMESDSIMLVDAETLEILDLNPVAERLWGYGRAELLKMKVTDLSVEPQNTRDSVQQGVGTVTIPLRWHRKKDGTVFPIEITANRFELNGRRTVLAAIRDISERQRAEAAVRASEEQYRAIFNASVDGMLLWDADHSIVDVNESFLRMHGYRREEVVGQTQPLFIPAALRGQCGELLPKVIAGEACRIESRALRKDGSEFEVEIHGVPMEYQGRPHVLVILRDLTLRRQAEERLRASEERYRLLFEMESDAMVLVDVETLQHLDVNRAAVDLYGYSRDELLGLRSTDLSAEADKTRSAMQSGATQEKSSGAVRVPLRYHRKRDGTLFPVEITANFFELNGRSIMLAAIRDITDRKQAEEERSRLEAQLRQAQKMEAIGQLAGGIAHDFNNILQSILGNLTLAGERAEDLQDAKLGRYLERAQLSAQRARELIQQMLTFSRGKRGEPRLLSPAPLLEEAARLLRPMLPATIELELQLEETPAVKIDRVQAEQVLLNLCINARDAMRGQGTIGLSVGESLEEGVCTACRQRFSGRFVALAVRDSGPGIAPGVADRMFEPFFSTKEVGKGSGMGLSMVHGIVHEHGGHVLVDSAPGEGAVFRVLLPVAAGETVSERKRAGPKAKPRLAGSILVVDDEPMILEFMGDLLAGWGLEVTLKSSGIEAKHAFAAEPQRYDLVLTDNTMPRITGLELARQIRGIRPGIPVILYTGYGEDIAESELAAAGVRALARKPVEPAELLALLKTHLQQIRNTLK